MKFCCLTNTGIHSGEQRITVTKMELPADRPPGRIIGKGVEAVPELIRLLQTEAKVL